MVRWSPTVAVRAAATWAFLFAILSFWWAIAVMAGLPAGTPSAGAIFEELGEERDTTLIVTLWLTGLLKAAAGLLVLALIQPWARPIPHRLLRLATWLAGLGMALYGLANFVDHSLMLSGLRDIPDGLGETAARWHLILWDPVWLLGGLLFIVASRATAGRKQAG